MSEFKVVNKNGKKEEFDEDKLYDSVYYPAREAELDEGQANELGEKVVWETKSWMSDHEDDVFTTEEVREKVMEVLQRQECDVCFLYRTHMDLN